MKSKEKVNLLLIIIVAIICEVFSPADLLSRTDSHTWSTLEFLWVISILAISMTLFAVTAVLTIFTVVDIGSELEKRYQLFKYTKFMKWLLRDDR